MFGLTKWSDWSIRARISATLIPAVLPMLAIAIITYWSHAETSIRSSEKITQLTVSGCTNEIDTFLMSQRDIFRKWTSEDVYGTGIELNRVDELGERFRKMASEGTGFDLLVLANAEGKVLASVESTPGGSKTGTLQGRTIHDAKRSIRTGTPVIEILRPDAYQQLTRDVSPTYLFSFPSRDSSGNVNGAFLAYVNPSELQNRTKAVHDQLLADGFAETQVVLYDPQTGGAMAHSNPIQRGITLELDQERADWVTDGSHAGQTREFEVAGVDWRVTFSPVLGIQQLNGFDTEETPSTQGASTGDSRVASPRLIVSIPSNTILAGVRNMLWSNAGIVLAGVTFLLVVFWWTARSITGPLKRTVLLLKDIAEGEGDLTRRLDDSGKDELSRLARWFNAFVEKLQGIIRDIAAEAKDLSLASNELVSTADSLASGAAEIAQQSSTAAIAAEEMSINMTNMSASGEEMTANVKTVAAAVEEMTASIGEIAKNAEQASAVASNASQLAKSSNENIGELGSAADEIGKVIETIQDIAEQTNLLALNATIEAARAGDAGKGFAVVATEVKELAKQTALATEDIRARIECIQSSTVDAIKSIGEISSVIEEVNTVSTTIALAVDEQSTTTKEIAGNISQTSNAAQAVSNAVAESASATQEIARSLAHMDQTVGATSRGASITHTSSSRLTEVSERLQTLVARFKTD